jgi:hypothetical protein
MTHSRNIPAAVLACGLIIVCTWNFSWTTGDPILAKHIWIQIVVVLGIVSFMIFGVRELGSINPWVAMLLVVVAASHFFSTYELPSIGLVLNKRMIYSPGTFSFYTLILGVLWYSMVVAAFTPQTIRWMLDAMCIVAAANMLFLYMQYFGYDPVNAAAVETLGMTTSTNHASALLAFCLPAFLRRGFYWGLPFLALAMAAVGPHGKGGMVAAGSGLILWLMLIDASLRVKIAGILATVAVICFVLSISVNVKRSVSDRLDMWSMAWDKFLQHKWFGYGIGQWQTALHEEYYIQGSTDTWHARSHNEFVQATVEFGVSFLPVAVGYFVNIARRCKRQAVIPLMALVIIVVNSMVNFPFHIPSTGMIAVSWLGILEVQLRET